jgi:cytochrome c553
MIISSGCRQATDAGMLDSGYGSFKEVLLMAFIDAFQGLAAVAALLMTTPAGTAQAPAVDESMARRVLACTACHGREGRAASDGFYPRIAGKPDGYLLQQLRAFRDGRRQYALMTSLLDPLSDDYLREIAAHFAAIDVPYPAPQPATVSADVLARGRALVLEGDAARQVPACVACHGAALTGVQPALPGLVGLPRDYLNAQLGAWRTGQRRALAPDCMARIARALEPQDIAAVSQWLAAQPVPAPARPAAALPSPMPLDCGGVAP